MKYWWIEHELSLGYLVEPFRDFTAAGHGPIEVPVRVPMYFLVRKKSLTSMRIDPMAQLSLPISGNNQPMYGACALLLSMELGLEGFYKHIEGTTVGMPEEVRKMVIEIKPHAVKQVEDTEIGFCEYRFSVDEEARVSIERGLNEPKLQTLHRKALQFHYQTMVFAFNVFIKAKSRQED